MKPRIPTICVDCVAKFQAKCPHLHVETTGGFHYIEGDVWDDIHEICIDCGVDLTDETLSLIEIPPFELHIP